jgi:hypothetical protein
VEEDLNSLPPATEDATTPELVEEISGEGGSQPPLPGLLAQPMDPEESDDEEEDPDTCGTSCQLLRRVQ